MGINVSITVKVTLNGTPVGWMSFSLILILSGLSNQAE